MEINLDVIFDYLFEHAWEIVLGVEMLFLKIFKKKSPEEIQAKKEQREKKRVEKLKKNLCKAVQDCEQVCVIPSYIGKTYQDKGGNE